MVRCKEDQDGRDDQGLTAAGFCGLGTLGEWKGGIDWMTMIYERYVAIMAVCDFQNTMRWQEGCMVFYHVEDNALVD